MRLLVWARQWSHTSVAKALSFLAGFSAAMLLNQLLLLHGRGDAATDRHKLVMPYTEQPRYNGKGKHYKMQKTEEPEPRQQDLVIPQARPPNYKAITRAEPPAIVLNQTDHNNQPAEPHRNAPAQAPAVELAQDAIKTSDGKQKVILLTYMRGGSTFLGELFNQDPDEAFIWFEPLDAVYSWLYGTQYGWHPPDIFCDAELNLRDMPAWEEAALVDSLHNTLSCSFSRLPLESLTHSFFTFIDSILNNKPYQKCMRRSCSMNCKSMLAKYICNKRVFPPGAANTSQGLSLSECSGVMQAVNSVPLDQPFDYGLLSGLEETLSHRKLGGGRRNRQTLTTQVKEYRQCMHEYQKKTQICVGVLQEKCERAKVTSAKVIRLRMRTAQKVLDVDPSTSLVLMFRDPRGIVLSRFKARYISRNSEMDMTREATMICNRMEEDYAVFQAVSSNPAYSGRVLMLRYEDTAADPVAAANAVYLKFLHTPVPFNVLKYLNISISGVEDNGKMGTIRKNGTETALKWRTQLRPDVINSITNICRGILEKLHYPVDL